MAANVVGVVRFMSRKVKCEICGATSWLRVHCAKGWGTHTTTITKKNNKHMINEMEFVYELSKLLYQFKAAYDNREI